MRFLHAGAVAALSALAMGCAGTVRVTPASPDAVPRGTPVQRAVSLYIDPEIERLRSSATTPSGDIGLGDITVEFDLGPAMAGTIRAAARQAFAEVRGVTARECAEGTAMLFAASLPTPPHIQIHWRGQTPRVGGGTNAELAVRITPQRCGAGAPLPSAVARGEGRAERMRLMGNWPSEEDFQPGIDMALRDLQANLTALFADMATASEAP